MNGGKLATRLRRALSLTLATAASWLRPDAARTVPAERTVLDDLAARRPWNIAIKTARTLARRRLDRLETGVTVVIVNWNTGAIIADVISAVQAFSPPDTQILVVDNGSTDGSLEILRRLKGIHLLRLPSNAGHGAALDLAMCRVQTDIAVTLDSDAFPLQNGWLDPIIRPIRELGAVVSGTRSSRDFVHPVFLALDVREFLSRRISFQIFLEPGVTGRTARWGQDAWDTAELLTLALPPDKVAFLDVEPPPSDLAGMVPGGFVGQLVYHHGGMTINSTGGRLADEAIQSWRAACKALGVDAVMPPEEQIAESDDLGVL